MTHAYYRGAHAVILMYDISSEQSFVSVKTWINSIEVLYLFVNHATICITE
jgi:GTPase SAR1 family protein